MPATSGVRECAAHLIITCMLHRLMCFSKHRLHLLCVVCVPGFDGLHLVRHLLPLNCCTSDVVPPSFQLCLQLCSLRGSLTGMIATALRAR
jgi:hypothetical protein